MGSWSRCAWQTSAVVVVLAAGWALAAAACGAVCGTGTELIAGACDAAVDRIGCFLPGGSLVEFELGVDLGFFGGQLTEGPDGNIWFIGQGLSPRIGRLTPQGEVTLFDTTTLDPDDGSGLTGLTAGP